MNVVPAFGTVNTKKASKKPSDNTDSAGYLEAKMGVFWGFVADNRELSERELGEGVGFRGS